LDEQVAITLAVLHLLTVAGVVLIMTAWGMQIQNLLRCRTESRLESLLFASGFAFAIIEIFLFFVVFVGRLTLGPAVTLLTLLSISAWSGWTKLWRDARSLLSSLRQSLESPFNRLVVLLISLILASEGLVAMAPLSGSDAMHYHFTVPRITLGKPLVPLFGLLHSFYLGQSHLLVSLGMSLGSDRISLGLIYVGGVLTAAALFVLARQLMPLPWAWVTVLVFVSSPLVFWQTSTSGSPDVWMAYFVTISVLAASRVASTNEDRWFILAGLFAGAAAGAKYTGWVLPFALVLYVLWRRRSVSLALLTSLGALASGIWPVARNFLWTGDPVFPFLSGFLTPQSVNWYALGAFRSMTGAANAHRDLLHLASFPFVLVLNGNVHGLGQLFGPLLLAFGPLLIFTRWEKACAPISAIFWAVMYVSVLLTSQMGRFLLPVFPLALALVFSGTAELFRRKLRFINIGIAGTIALFVTFSAMSEAVYASNFFPVVFGKESVERFLEREASDYRVTEFVNEALRDREPKGGNVMVFFRHLYYLRIPFVDGAPEYSWLMNPSTYNDEPALRSRLHELNVRWVVKAPDYPVALSEAFNELEKDGALIPEASIDIDSLGGTGRIYGEHKNVHVVLLRVRDYD